MSVDQGVFEAEGLSVVGLTELGFDGNFLAFVAPPPAALVAGLAQCNAIDPGAQTGVSVEAANAAVNLDEDVLGQVSGVRGVWNGARNQAVDGLMILGDQPGKRFLRTGLQFGDNSGFF